MTAPNPDSVRRVPLIIESDGTCPHDSRFVHRFYFGCVPADFSDRTGRSRTFTQRAPVPPAVRWRWNGGCDAQIDGSADGAP